MKLFVGKLLEVQTGEFNSLIFQSQRFDVGLSRYVECSESVAISKECMGFLGDYKQQVGQVMAVGINVIPTKKGGVFSLATTKPLELSEII